MLTCDQTSCECSGSTLASMVKGNVAMAFGDGPQLVSLAVILAVGVALYAGGRVGRKQPGARFGGALVSSPVLLVWTALLGTIGFGFPGAAVLAFTALAALGAVAWLRCRGLVEAPCCGPGCDCHAPGNEATWGIAPESMEPTGAAQGAIGGWVNAVVQLAADVDTDWGAVARQCLEQVVTELAQRQARLHHLKLLLTTAAGPTAEGDTSAPAMVASLILNVRAEVGPDDLRGLIGKALGGAATGPRRARVVQMQNLRLGGPRPSTGVSPTVAN